LLKDKICDKVTTLEVEKGCCLTAYDGGYFEKGRSHYTFQAGLYTSHSLKRKTLRDKIGSIEVFPCEVDKVEYCLDMIYWGEAQPGDERADNIYKTWSYGVKTSMSVAKSTQDTVVNSVSASASAGYKGVSFGTEIGVETTVQSTFESAYSQSTDEYQEESRNLSISKHVSTYYGQPRVTATFSNGDIMTIAGRSLVRLNDLPENSCVSVNIPQPDGAMDKDCTDCYPCDWNDVDKQGRNSLGGGGHTWQECTDRCQRDTNCNFAAFYETTGYCHVYATCQGRNLKSDKVTLWRKIRYPRGSSRLASNSGIDLMI